MSDVDFTLNGETRSVSVGTTQSLLSLLRDELELPGSKNACEQGECGSCTVLMDGAAVCACLVLAADADGSDITTVEGMASGDVLHAVQDALVAGGGVQCGFCTPGFVVAAAHLFESEPSPDRDQIREALSGNICRCTGYGAILRSLEDLAQR
ncbi:MAG: (2Fe-2S)-binding protein [Acidimicrobiia bacterium]|nr:(2Fe-2S)-binding protein [Acidimicrobiia bacterium]MBT8215274.1 (2Fe-2S)-binding protein [Acidimicrobiia bacterium]NNF10649.1 (2Fe-2S)-binding protein [Acidimicrobiia bacterium]NNL71608.1 (2Fe-2S)-binding protein [Acidimicrobiia bacterium]